MGYELRALVASCVLAACSQSVTPAWQDGGDVGAHDAARTDAQVPVDAGGFCSDPGSARIALNGVTATSPAPSAAELFLNCCESAILHVVTARFTDPIAVLWRHQIGQGPDLPVTLDLANLPPGWTVSLLDGCDPTMSNCTPTDRYDSGLTGMLRIERNAGRQVRMSTCLEATESASMPHPLIHSLQLWVPSVTTM